MVTGGGVSHRHGLYDAVLIKENHAALAGGVGAAARAALAGAPDGMLVEVECRDLARARGGAGRRRVRGSCSTTWRREALREAVALAAGRAELEASGGVSLDTVRAIAETGVDFISVGALTHSAPALDLSLAARAALELCEQRAVPGARHFDTG